MTTPREITIRIEGRPPTPNARPDSMHQQWAALRQWKLAALRTTQSQLPLDFGPPMDQADMHVTFVVPDRQRRDLDNLVASQKPLLDGIVEAKVIRDDTLEVLRIVSFDWRIERGLQATVYTIREIPQERLGL